ISSALGLSSASRGISKAPAPTGTEPLLVWHRRLSLTRPPVTRLARREKYAPMLWGLLSRTRRASIGLGRCVVVSAILSRQPCSSTAPAASPTAELQPALP